MEELLSSESQRILASRWSNSKESWNRPRLDNFLEEALLTGGSAAVSRSLTATGTESPPLVD